MKKSLVSGHQPLTTFSGATLACTSPQNIWNAKLLKIDKTHKELVFEKKCGLLQLRQYLRVFEELGLYEVKHEQLQEMMTNTDNEFKYSFSTYENREDFPGLFGATEYRSSHIQDSLENMGLREGEHFMVCPPKSLEHGGSVKDVVLTMDGLELYLLTNQTSKDFVKPVWQFLNFRRFYYLFVILHLQTSPSGRVQTSGTADFEEEGRKVLGEVHHSKLRKDKKLEAESDTKVEGAIQHVHDITGTQKHGLIECRSTKVKETPTAGNVDCMLEGGRLPETELRHDLEQKEAGIQQYSNWRERVLHGHDSTVSGIPGSSIS